MSFVTLPPSPASPPATVVEGDGWFPDVDCTAIRNELRIGETVTHARLVAAIEGGIIAMDGELADWRAAQETAGALSLADVAPDRTINGKHRLTVLYTRAVQFAAAAELAELHRDLTATSEGRARAETQLLAAEDYRKLATWAVRDMIGTTRTAVELI